MTLSGAINNPNVLPNAVTVRFVLLAMTSLLMVLFYIGPTAFLFRALPADKPWLTIGVFCGYWATVLLLYMLHPLYCRRRFPITTKVGRDTEIFSDIDLIRRSFRLRPVRVYSNGNIWNTDAIAFGIPFARSIALDRGLFLLHQKAPDKFKARIAHELGHIRNGDVDTGFLELAMVLACALLSAALVCVFLGVSVFNAAHTDWEAPAAREQFAFTFAQGILSYLGSMLAWFVILWLEHRAFIRSREFAADVEAAVYTTPETVIATIGGVGSGETGNRFTRFLVNLIAAHPSREARSSNIQQLSRAGRVRWSIFIIFGYFWHLTFILRMLISAYYRKDAGAMLMLFSSSNSLNLAIHALASDAGFALAYVALVVALSVSYLFLVVVMIRFAMNSVITRQSIGRFLIDALAAFIFLCLGASLTLLPNPYSIFMVVALYPNDVGIIGPIWVMLPANFLSFAFVLLSMITIRLVMSFLLHGRRQTRVGAIEWSMFAILVFLVINEAWALFNTVISEDEEIRNKGFFLYGSGLLIMATVAAVAGYFIRNGLRRPFVKPTTVLSPWLTSY